MSFVQRKILAPIDDTIIDMNYYKYYEIFSKIFKYLSNKINLRLSINGKYVGFFDLCQM